MANKKFRLMVIGLAHLPCNPYYNACGFTMKNYKFCKMMMELGHDVWYFGAEGSTVPCNKFIQTHNLSNIREDYGEADNRFEVGYDFRRDSRFKVDFGSESKKISTQKLFSKSIEVINATKKPDDFLMLTMGWYQKSIADNVKMFLTCEPGVGYKGNYAGAQDWRWRKDEEGPICYPGFRAFESHFMRSYMQGVESCNRDTDGNSYDRVIPNSFERDEFEFSDKKKDYILYLGRLTQRKGIMIAYLACQEAGVKLVLAGPGGKIMRDGSFVSKTEPQVNFPKGNWEYVGYADIEKRKILMRDAKALILPTAYLEPFGGVVAEAALSGTPAIVSANGIFGGDEVCVHGVTGFRNNTMEDYVWSIKNVDRLDHYVIRKHGEKYLAENIKFEYQNWMEDLHNLYLNQQDKRKDWKSIVNQPEPEWRSKRVTIFGKKE